MVGWSGLGLFHFPHGTKIVKDWQKNPRAAGKSAAVATQATYKLNFSGTWKLRSTATEELFTIKHREPNLRVIMRVSGDALGLRTMDWVGRTDRQEYRQTVLGLPGTFIGWWEGSDLMIENTRDSGGGRLMTSRRKMTLSADGKTITVIRTIPMLSPERGWDEI